MKDNETPEQKSKRQLYLESLKGKYPDANYDDDDDVFDLVSKEQEERDGKIGKYEEESKKLVDLFSSDPRSAELFNVWKDGGDPISYLMENFGDEFKAALDDPEQKDKFAQSYSKWLENVGKSKELKQQSDENLQATFSTLEAYQQEHNLSDEDAVKIFDAAHQIILDGIVNVIKPETFDMVAKALNYDVDVAEAQRVGEVRGRNAKIEEKLKKDETPAGVPPTLTGSGAGDLENKPKKKPYNPFLA